MIHSKMTVEMLRRSMVDSDLGVVNAARCSFDKESKELTDKDVKLIKYLALHNHWTPFAHPHETFEMYVTDDDILEFLLNANLAGFEWTQPTKVGKLNKWRVMGSLYAWLKNAQHLPCGTQILKLLREKYPVSTKAVVSTVVSTTDDSSVTVCSDSAITLRLHVPIFVKRQLETHRRNFVLTDMHDFSQNEVSRRYVSAEPEFYEPSEWRLQSDNKKQGSSDEVIEGTSRYLTYTSYEHVCYLAASYYRVMNERKIAHEQTRMILPLSTFTTFWWTGSLKAWERMLTLRLGSDVQGETREVAQQIHMCITHGMQ